MPLKLTVKFLKLPKKSNFTKAKRSTETLAPKLFKLGPTSILPVLPTILMSEVSGNANGKKFTTITIFLICFYSITVYCLLKDPWWQV